MEENKFAKDAKIYKVNLRVWYKDGRYIEKEYDGSNSVQWSADDVKTFIIDIEN